MSKATELIEKYKVDEIKATGDSKFWKKVLDKEQNTMWSAWVKYRQSLDSIAKQVGVTFNQEINGKKVRKLMDDFFDAADDSEKKFLAMLAEQESK